MNPLKPSVRLEAAVGVCVSDHVVWGEREREREKGEREREREREYALGSTFQ